MKNKQVLATLLCAASVFSVSLWLIASPVRNTTETQRHRDNLQAIANSALGQREGAIVILDPQTGRMRAVVNQEVAFGTSIPPGSAIKPFTALVALQTGVITHDTRIRCRQKSKREDVVDNCSHPQNLGPFTPAEALAHSCNYYFASMLQGFRPHGWFVGLVFGTNTKAEPLNAQLVVVVYLKNAHGSDAAEVARPIFEAFAGKPASKNNSSHVTVNKVSENTTQKVSLEDYVLQVVATEASVEDEPEAIKALAIAARTYALKNIGRHSEQGYDFCSTTHCQRFELTEARTDMVAAVGETAGFVLRDDRDELADSYYSASCGGMTANLKSIWNTDAPDYLRGVRDSYCRSGSHHRWTDVIASAKSLRRYAAIHGQVSVKQFAKYRCRNRIERPRRTSNAHRRPSPRDKRLGIQADRRSSVGLAVLEEFAIHSLAVRIGVCISRWRVRTRFGSVPGGVTRDGTTRTIVSTDPRVLFSGHEGKGRRGDEEMGRCGDWETGRRWDAVTRRRTPHLPVTMSPHLPVSASRPPTFN